MSKGTYSHSEQPGLFPPRRKPTTLTTGTAGGVLSLGSATTCRPRGSIHVARGRPCAPRMQRDNDCCGAQGRTEAKHRGQRNGEQRPLTRFAPKCTGPNRRVDSHCGTSTAPSRAGEAGAPPYHSSFRTPKTKGTRAPPEAEQRGARSERADGGTARSLFERKNAARSAFDSEWEGVPSARSERAPRCAASESETRPITHKPQLPLGANAITLYAIDSRACRLA